MASFPVRRSARIKQRQQRQQQSDLAVSQSILEEEELDSDLPADPELWCSCQGYDDGRLMICCDRKGEDCCVWYNYDCLGLTIEEGRRIEASDEDFVCPSCRRIQSDPTDPSFIVDTPYLLNPSTDFQWGEISGQISGHTFCNFILKKLFIGGAIFFGSIWEGWEEFCV